MFPVLLSYCAVIQRLRSPSSLWLCILQRRARGLCAQVWDSSTLQCKRTLEGHEDNVRVLAVGARHVFSGSWDKTIRVWDVDTLECVKVRAGQSPRHWLSVGGSSHGRLHSCGERAIVVAALCSSRLTVHE